MEGTLRPESVREETSDGSRLAAIPWVRDALLRMPWWAASAVGHLALLLAATAIVFSTRETAPEKKRITILQPPAVKSLPPIQPPPAVSRATYDENFDDRLQEDEGAQVDHLKLDPEAKLADHIEDAMNQPFEESFGNKDYSFVEYIEGGPGQKGLLDDGPDSRTDALGVGGGAGRGGGWGDGRGGTENLRAQLRVNKPLYGPVKAGLRWLAGHQDADGRWSSDGFSGCCPGGKCAGAGLKGHDVGMTGLALLAFLGAGITPSTRERGASFVDPLRKDRIIHFADTVRTGLRWLRDRQDGGGCFGEQKGEFMYDHAIAALAMTEAAWLTLTPLYKDPARKGIDFLCRARNPGYAWRYGVRPGNNDTSVTGWAVMALKSAELSGVPFDREAYQGVREWLRRVTNSQGKVGYESPGDLGSVLEGVNDAWMSHPAMTAAGLLARIFIDKKGDPWMKVAANEIVKDLPVWNEKARSVDFYYWYYASLALFQFDAPHGPAWKAMDEAMRKALIPHQEKPEAGCRHGSWDPAADRWGMVGGRVYATALNVLTLEVSFRYPQVFVGNRQ